MLKSIVALTLCVALVFAGLTYSKRAEATTGWYFVSVCNTPSECYLDFYGGAPIWFGPYTEAECYNQQYLWSNSALGTRPRGLSNCFPM